jgi:hypothetical protein
LSFWKGTFNGLGKSGKIIHTGNINSFHALFEKRLEKVLKVLFALELLEDVFW